MSLKAQERYPLRKREFEVTADFTESKKSRVREAVSLIQ